MKSKVLCHNMQFNSTEESKYLTSEIADETPRGIVAQYFYTKLRSLRLREIIMWKYLDALIQRWLSAFSLLSLITIDCTLTLFFLIRIDKVTDKGKDGKPRKNSVRTEV